MVLLRADPLRTPDDPSWNGSQILNGAGKIVLILDPTSELDLGILSVEYRKNLERSAVPQKAPKGAGGTVPPGDAPSPSLPATQEALSGRQRDVLKLIVQGMSNKEIARALGLAEGTVKIHVSALFSKLRVHRRSAVAIAGARFLSDSGS